MKKLICRLLGHKESHFMSLDAVWMQCLRCGYEERSKYQLKPHKELKFRRYVALSDPPKKN